MAGRKLALEAKFEPWGFRKAECQQTNPPSSGNLSDSRGCRCCTTQSQGATRPPPFALSLFCGGTTARESAEGHVQPMPRGSFLQRERHETVRVAFGKQRVRVDNAGCGGGLAIPTRFPTHHTEITDRWDTYCVALRPSHADDSGSAGNLAPAPHACEETVAGSDIHLVARLGWAKLRRRRLATHARWPCMRDTMMGRLVSGHAPCHCVKLGG